MEQQVDTTELFNVLTKWWGLAGGVLETEIRLHQSCDGSWLATRPNFLLWPGLSLFILQGHFLVSGSWSMDCGFPTYFSWMWWDWIHTLLLADCNQFLTMRFSCFWFRAMLTNGGSRGASGTINSLELLALLLCTFGVDLGTLPHTSFLSTSFFLLSHELWVTLFCIWSF